MESRSSISPNFRELKNKGITTGSPQVKSLKDMHLSIKKEKKDIDKQADIFRSEDRYWKRKFDRLRIKPRATSPSNSISSSVSDEGKLGYFSGTLNGKGEVCEWLREDKRQRKKNIKKQALEK